MIDVSSIPFDWLILGLAAYFAGLVDAVVGGGGLIQTPVLLTQFPQTPLYSVFGTNKIASFAGTSLAAWRLCRRIPVPWGIVLPATGMALLGAWGGASMVAWLPRTWMQPLVLVMMIGAAVYTFSNKDFGHATSRPPVPADRWRGALLGLCMGLYDGFFGPGTGSLLIFAFIRLFGMDFMRATASAKVINWATNIAAIVVFAHHGPLMWSTGFGMAACNMLGAQSGAVLALRQGSPFIRKVFLLVVLVLIGKLARDMAVTWGI